ncbi:zinc knuckle CX2CX4HX4C containing protein [Tanacetum coccineum]
MGRGGKGTGKRTRSSKRLNGDQALTDHDKHIVTEEVSQPDTVPTNGDGLNGYNNINEVLVHETTSNVTGSFDADKSMQFGKNLSNEDIVVSLFGVPLSSIEDVDVLTRKIEVGDYDELKEGMTSDEWKAAMGAVKAEWKKLIFDVTSTTKVPTNEDIGPKEDIPIVKSVSFTKPVLYVEAMGASLSKPSTGKANFRHLVSDNVFDGVQILIPMNVVQTVSSRLENTLYGYFIGKRIAFTVVEYFVRNNWVKYGLTRLMMNSRGFFFFKFDSIKGLEDVLESGPWMIRNSPIILKKWTMNTRPCKEELTLPIILDSFTSLMCIESWGRSSFARCLIEIKADEDLKESITMGIPLPKGKGFTKEMVRVEYEWKPPRCEQCKIYGHMNDQCPKNATTIPNVMNNDGFQTVVNKKKCSKTGFTIVKTTWQPINQKVRFYPKSHGKSQKENNGNIVHSVSKEKPSKAAYVPSSSFSRVLQRMEIFNIFIARLISTRPTLIML